MSLDNLLGGPKLPGVSFPEVGSKVTCTVIDGEPRDATKPDGTVKRFPDGNAMRQVVLTVKVDELDPSIPDDDGTRRWFLKWQQQKVLITAVAEAKAKLEKGGRIAMIRVADQAPSVPAHSATHMFRAQYLPPDPTSELITSEPSDGEAAAPAVRPLAPVEDLF